MIIIINKEFDKIFKKYNLPRNNILGSKSGYCKTYPENFVLFNAYLLDPITNQIIWKGDIDLTKSKNDLNNMVKDLNMGELLLVYEIRDVDDIQFEKQNYVYSTEKGLHTRFRDYIDFKTLTLK